MFALNSLHQWPEGDDDDKTCLHFINLLTKQVENCKLIYKHD